MLGSEFLHKAWIGDYFCGENKNARSAASSSNIARKENAPLVDRGTTSPNRSSMLDF